MSTGMERLSSELSYFDANRKAWVQEGHEGEWAVVHGASLIGFFHSLEDGFREGARRFGKADFLVKEVTLEDRIEKIQRASWETRGR